MLVHLNDPFGNRLDLSDTGHRLLTTFSCDHISAVTKRTYNTTENDKEETIREVFKRFDTILYDCDELLGCDHETDHSFIAEAIKFIDSLRQKNKRLIFTSNRSDKSRQQMLLKIKSLGIDATVDEMFSTSYSTAVYLKAIDFQREVLVVGSEAVTEELNQMGIRTIAFPIDVCPHSVPKYMDPGFTTFHLNPNVGAVVLTFDNHIPLPYLVKAISYATKPDCLFIVTNPDTSDPDSRSRSHVTAIQVGANKGFISLGKPHKFYFSCIRQTHPNVDPQKTLIITARLHSDIAFGRNNGIKSVFVESRTLFNDYKVQRIDKHFTPDFVANNLSSLAQIF